MSSSWSLRCLRLPLGNILLLLLCVQTPLAAQQASPTPPLPTSDEQPITLRCAVIGGMHDTSFWQELTERFTEQTGIEVEMSVTGPKRVIAKSYVVDNLDLITMHASDTIINLVADGYAENPQPWARNDLVVVGPTSDPAGIRGERDVAIALEKLIRSNSKIVIHSSLGANEVLRDILDEVPVPLNPANTLMLPSDRHRQMLVRAEQEQGYTLVGRIPFLNGKIEHEGMSIMVQGDPRLRRPYVVATAPADRIGANRNRAACQLATFLRQKDTQDWIASFGIGHFDEHPLFYPITLPSSTPTHEKIIPINAQVLAGLMRTKIRVTLHDGIDTAYEGVLLSDLLSHSDIALGEKLRGHLVDQVIVAEASDHYRATFSLVELDPATQDKVVLIADRRDGQPLDEAEGPFRLIVPEEQRHVRWVRMLTSLRLTRPATPSVN
ncbi:MAG: substrate-binding domain-containing protein [Pirellulaceae bacterium]|nr:substrate-binding domain-containing protein [Planctomycetales bacterium]